MNKIEFLKENRIKLNGITYKGYSICELPNQFGMTEDIMDDEGNVINRLPLIDEWFNYKGLTYIIE
tara:strand:- start:248 stop:445 length:198 start_codon:yes stop_codon:yes gene_type:complete